MHRTLRAGAAALALAAALAVPDRATAGGFGIPEIGVRRTAMAAMIGRPDEPAAAFHNPAGLSLLPGVRLYASFGLALLSTEFRLKPWDQSDRFLTEPVDSEGYFAAIRPTRAVGAIPMLAATAEILPGKLWGGLAAYVSNGTGAQFAEDAVTRYHLIDGYIIAPTVTAIAAYQVHPKLALGAGAGVMNIQVHGKRHLFPILNGSDVSSIVGSNAELVLDGEDWKFTWNAGLLARPIPRLTVGATVIGRVDPSLEGIITLTTGDDAGNPGDRYEGKATTGLVLPWTFLGGANYDVTPKLELGGELRYYLYRAYKEQLSVVDGLPFVTELRTEKNYKDSWQLAGGARVHDLEAAPALELMGGFHYDDTPAPAQTVTLDQPTFSHYGLHLGGRYQLGRYRLAASYVHYWYVIPQIDDSITLPPSNIRGDGTNNIFTVSIEAQLGGALR
ncbi:MAG: outer membrane protein transport protein [Kofleriaceae bacterium]|jgi:long-subunit fatty acid transport protein|nr:outer membrane protein transport protein [Kofleriaceae bacterium]MBP9168472.1 outer membrane protein transport protein [Kofleriaceae bacterium]MBP9858920.1 outer membrane protein transport protein [Kofleriaceae bacterium]